MNDKPSRDARLLAALAHAAILTGGIGPIAGIFIFVTQKDKSTYAAGQALQAVVYQFLGILVTIIAWSCWGLFYAVTFIPIVTAPEQYSDAPPPIFWVGMASMIVPFIVMGIWGLYGLYGAFRAWAGAEFRYVIIGPAVEKWLEQ